jgi:hypothetical protein
MTYRAPDRRKSDFSGSRPGGVTTRGSKAGESSPAEQKRSDAPTSPDKADGPAKSPVNLVESVNAWRERQALYLGRPPSDSSEEGQNQDTESDRGTDVYVGERRKSTKTTESADASESNEPRRTRLATTPQREYRLCLSDCISPM